MPIRFQKMIYRKDLQRNPEWRYVFGDNARRKGLGGQAKEMRGEPNAIGVATKWFPEMAHEAFMSDYDHSMSVVMGDFEAVIAALKQNRVVVFPLDGIGTGLAELPKRAPRLSTYIVNLISTLGATYGIID